MIKSERSFGGKAMKIYMLYKPWCKKSVGRKRSNEKDLLL